MPATYRLLRDNKQSGPFSLEELLQLNLKPFDLVWVDGKSVGWRYPSEIDSLKPYLNDVSEEPVEIEQQISSIIEGQKQTITNSASASTDKPANDPYLNDTTVTQEKDEITAEKLEQKANEIYLRVQAYTKQKELGGTEPQTYYARSLDNLKQEYADWIHHSKNKKRFTISRGSLMLGSFLLVAGLALYLIFANNNSENTVPLKENYYLSHTIEKPAKYSKQKPPTAIHSNQASSSKSSEHNSLSVDQFLDSVNKELAKQDERLRVARIRSNYKKPKPITPLVQPLANGAEQIDQMKKPELIELIKMEAKYILGARKNISSIQITIFNNSPELLNHAAVDVFYYKNGEKLLDKRTVYFNNIHPGNSFTLTKPGNKKAVSATFQLTKAQ